MNCAIQTSVSTTQGLTECAERLGVCLMATVTSMNSRRPGVLAEVADYQITVDAPVRLWGLGGSLTRDCMVTYCRLVTDDDRVFKALADTTRRFLLDRLFTRDGRTLTDLESELEMTRFGVMKHLRVLEDANLVVSRRSGREKLHFLNPVPIQQIHDRWIDKYTALRASALAELKSQLEDTA